MYDQFYGLSGRPFQLTPDPHYYFESGTHRKALSYLGYGLAQGEGFIVITGEVGAGKSSLVGHLMQTIDRARLSAATIVTSQLDGHDMVQMVAESYGIDSRGLDKAATLKAIENFLHAEARAGRRCLLVIDEAQNLAFDALEELRMLSNFQLGASALLQIFLLGQPEFREMVQNAPEVEQLRQRVIATHHLDAMDADEIEPYVVHRLQKASWTGRPTLTEDAFIAIYDETGGMPRKINALMNRVMLMGAVEKLDILDGMLISAVIADMAGKPFEYEAPLSAHGEVALPAAPETVALEPAPFSLAPETTAAIPEPAAVVTESVVPPVAPNVLDVVDEPGMAEPVSAAVVPHPSAPAVQVIEPVKAQDSAELVARVKQLEAHIAAQDASIQRVLAKLVEWMDKENQSLASEIRNIRAA